MLITPKILEQKVEESRVVYFYLFIYLFLEGGRGRGVEMEDNAKE